MFHAPRGGGLTSAVSSERRWFLWEMEFHRLYRLKRKMGKSRIRLWDGGEKKKKK